MTVTRNDCCGCAVPSYPCIHCCEDYEETVCDFCGEELATHRLNEQEACKGCILEQLTQYDGESSQECCKCSSKGCELYQYEGEWYCEDCIFEQLETV